MSLIAYIKGGAKGSLLSAGSFAASSPKLEAQVNGKVGLNANALEYNAESADATPTTRGSGPAVGALAAEKADKIR
jgi:hypothetical protein